MKTWRPVHQLRYVSFFSNDCNCDRLLQSCFGKVEIHTAIIMAPSTVAITLLTKTAGIIIGIDNQLLVGGGLKSLPNHLAYNCRYIEEMNKPVSATVSVISYLKIRQNLFAATIVWASKKQVICRLGAGKILLSRPWCVHDDIFMRFANWKPRTIVSSERSCYFFYRKIPEHSTDTSRTY